MRPSTETTRPRTLSIAYALVFGVSTVLAFVLARRTGILVFVALSGLSLWALVIAVVNNLPRLPFRLGEVIRGLGVLSIVATATWFYFVRVPVYSGAT